MQIFVNLSTGSGGAKKTRFPAGGVVTKPSIVSSPPDRARARIPAL